MTPVLLVEDDAGIATVITAALKAEGLGVTCCDSLAARDALLAERRFAALVTDVMLGDGDGIASLKPVRARHPMMPIIILSARNTLDTAVRAADVEAFEYFPKPFDIEELVRTVRRAVGMAQGGLTDADDDALDTTALPLVGHSAPMQAVYRMVTRVLRNDLTVLILGESGTGKELIAEAIHRFGARRTGPFVAVNTAAIPAELVESELFGHEKGAFTGAMARQIGKFEAASGGTLFLDEIGDMPIAAQTRLLRALQSGTIRRVGGHEEVRVDTRIICATNRDLVPMIADGRFREDLYYRIQVVPIVLPPLRERTDDIAPLARHFLALAAAEGLPRRQLTVDALALLRRQPWRGNVRELRNVIYRLALLARDTVVDAAALVPLLTAPPMFATPGCEDASEADLDNTPDTLDAAVTRWLAQTNPAPGMIHEHALAALERPLFRAVLRASGGNQLRAARMLGINRNTLRKRLSALALGPDGGARES